VRHGEVTGAASLTTDTSTANIARHLAGDSGGGPPFALTREVMMRLATGGVSPIEIEELDGRFGVRSTAGIEPGPPPA
jgi:hypothetical protein